MKEDLLVSVSGGATSGFMAWWLWNNKRSEYRMTFVFANTGVEDERTLQFVDSLEKHFDIKIIWVEGKVYHNEARSTGYTKVNFNSASRNGEPFEEVIQKYGVPNQKFLHCTRELKENPIHNWAKDHLKDNYYTAIGIRADEADRINPKAKENRFIYPLVSMIPMTKKMVNEFWKTQPFRLGLKDYEGNCKTCWKKSDAKLYRIAKENPSAFDFFHRMETQYGNGYTFFRGSRSTQDILMQAKEAAKQLSFDDLVGGDTCEIYSECKQY